MCLCISIFSRLFSNSYHHHLLKKKKKRQKVISNSWKNLGTIARESTTKINFAFFSRTRKSLAPHFLTTPNVCVLKCICNQNPKIIFSDKLNSHFHLFIDDFAKNKQPKIRLNMRLEFVLETEHQFQHHVQLNFYELSIIKITSV